MSILGLGHAEPQDGNTTTIATEANASQIGLNHSGCTEGVLDAILNLLKQLRARVLSSPLG